MELLARLGATHGAPILINEAELNQWPSTAVAAMKSQHLLVKARPAASAICPGCERECVMPVHTPPAAAGGPAPFIVCDKRSDINRVAVPIEVLEQWQTSGELIADLLSELLSLRRPDSIGADAARWQVGLLEGTRNRSHLVLLGDGELTLSLAGHSIRLADVVAFERGRIVVDKRMLFRSVNQPVAGGGDAKSAKLRSERLKARVAAEKSKGTKAFLKTVAEEEDMSISRLKQILKYQPVSATD